MKPERWEQLKGVIFDRFKIEDQGAGELDPGPGKIEYFEFHGPVGLMRVEWIEKPRVLEKKVHSSKRIGSQVTAEYVYSEQEKVYHFMMYRFDDAQRDWVEIEEGDVLDAL